MELPALPHISCIAFVDWSLVTVTLGKVDVFIDSATVTSPAPGCSLDLPELCRCLFVSLCPQVFSYGFTTIPGGSSTVEEESSGAGGSLQGEQWHNAASSFECWPILLDWEMSQPLYALLGSECIALEP